MQLGSKLQCQTIFRWDTPGGKLEAGETPAAAMVRELEEELSLRGTRPRALGWFDDVDVAAGQIVRHHVFDLDVDRAAVRPTAGVFRWIEGDRLATLAPQNGVVVRTLAIARARAGHGARC